MIKINKLLSCLLISIACVGQSFASMQATSFPQETRLVRFVYDKNRSYDIITRPNAVTDIQLGSNETLDAFVLGDTVQWIYDEATGHVLIKPTRENLFTSATIITNKRTYQLQLRSMPVDGNWYQRVSWEYPKLVIARKNLVKKAQAEEKRISDLSAGPISSPENLNFKYSVKGKAAFKPVAVFDDGRFTWIQLPKSLQEVPAAFISDKSGKHVLVNYVIKGDFIVVQRLAKKIVLKTGSSEVFITKNTGFFSSNSNDRDLNNLF